MSDCLYGKLNSETIKKEYSAEETETVSLSIDNVKNKISARVKKTPGTLKITKSVNTGEKKTLVEFNGSESKEINLDEVDAYTGIENETSKTTVDTEHNTIDVEVKRTPGKIKFEKGGKILTDHLNREVEFDGSEDTTLHIPETSFETTETFETVYDETSNRVKGNVLKTPSRLIINNPNDGTANIFDGSEEVVVNLPSSAPEIDLTDYVKNTDYATASKGGVVKAQNVTTANRGVYINGEGFLSLKPATEAEIVAKSPAMYNVISPANLDNAVKVGITTNTIELTEEEKTSALNWLGVPACGIETLVGTSTEPIKIPDLETGHLYNVSGYVRVGGVAKELPRSILIHKTADLSLTVYGAHYKNKKFVCSAGKLMGVNLNSSTKEWANETNYHVVGSINGYIDNIISFYAPTSSGTSGQILQSNGMYYAPTWFTPDYASQSYVDTQIANLVDSAPETLDTLNELATAIQEHKDILDAIGELPTVTRLI